MLDNDRPKIWGTTAAPGGSRLRITGHIGSTFYGWDGYGNYVHVVVRDDRAASQIRQALCYARIVEYDVPFE